MNEDGARFFGPGPWRLLSGVRETGSLSAAAKNMGMSYSKAMHIVHRAEAALGLALTTRSIGGDRGGSSRLTHDGEELLRRSDLWSCSVSRASVQNFEAAFAGMADVPKLGCVVMASGCAQRFGRQKLLEPLYGRSVLSRALDALPMGRLDVVVATRWPEVREICESRHMSCAEPAGGLQSDTVRCGITALGKRAGYLFVQGDQPLLSKASVDLLLDEFASNPHSVVRLSWRERRGSPVVFPCELAGALLTLTGDVGGGEVLRRNPDMVALVRCVEARFADELDDIDTPADLERMRQACKGRYESESLL